MSPIVPVGGILIVVIFAAFVRVIGGGPKPIILDITCDQISSNQPAFLVPAEQAIYASFPDDLHTENTMLGMQVMLQMQCARGGAQTVRQLSASLLPQFEHEAGR